MGTTPSNCISEAAESQILENNPQNRTARRDVFGATAVISCAVKPGFDEPVPAALRTPFG
jgi:hypothetical protein